VKLISKRRKEEGGRRKEDGRKTSHVKVEESVFESA
jgi:hypothetical protein